MTMHKFFRAAACLFVVAVANFQLASCAPQPSSSTSIQEKDWAITYLAGDFKVSGPDRVGEGETLNFSVDYGNSWCNQRLKVTANDVDLRDLGAHNYQIENVRCDYRIKISALTSAEYALTLPTDKALYDIYAFEDKATPDGNFTFYLKFWNEIDLSEVEIKADLTLVYPENFSGSYQTSVLYTFNLANVNRDVDVIIEGAFRLTWYQYRTDSEIFYEHSVAATRMIEPVKLGFSFVGWTLEKDNVQTLIALPYRNTTAAVIVDLYALFSPEFPADELPLITIATAGAVIASGAEYTAASFSIKSVDTAKTVDCGIRIRGNSTATYPKKPYKIKFTKAQSFFNSIEYKNWVLLADYLDASLIKNYTAYRLSNSVGSSNFTFTLQHVEVIVNGIYQGVYLLTDQIQENDRGRVNIEVDQLGADEVPFLLERDAEGEGVYGVNWFTVGISNYIIKYPRNPTVDQFQYIFDYIETVYTLITRGQLAQLEFYLDLTSLMDYCLLNELMLNFDADYKSGFMFKPLDGKLTVGPVWDFDWALTIWSDQPSTDQEFVLGDQYFLLKRDPSRFSFDWMLYLVQDQSIYDRLVERWQNLANIWRFTITVLNDYYDYLAPAGLRNYEKWYSADYSEGGTANYVPIDNLFTDQYKYVVNALNERSQKMNAELSPNNHGAFVDAYFSQAQRSD